MYSGAVLESYHKLQRLGTKSRAIYDPCSLFQEDAVQLSEVAHQLAEHARLKVTGKYRHEKSVFVGPRPKTVNGSPTAGWVLPHLREEYSLLARLSVDWGSLVSRMRTLSVGACYSTASVYSAVIRQAYFLTP